MLWLGKSISVVGVFLLFISTTTPASGAGPSIKPTQLQTPQNIVVTPTLPIGNFSVSWSAVPNVSSYTVRVYSSSGSKLVGNPVTGLTTTSTIISRSANTSYRVSVQAIGNGTTYSNSLESGKFLVTTYASTYAVTWNDSCPAVTTCTAHIGGSSTYATTAAITSIPTTPPTATGYIFGGWFTQALGAGIQVTNGSYTPAAPYGAITLYAKWSAAVCATGAACRVGDTGPGGGVVYYVNTAGFNCGPGYTSTGSPTGSTCKYLEVAPSGWNSGADPLKVWAITAMQGNSVLGITNEISANNSISGVGLGYKNSIAIVSQGNDTSTAAGAARAYRGGTKNDWYLPTTAELNLLCQWNRGVSQSLTISCAGGALNSGTGVNGGFLGNLYWSSSGNTANSAWFQQFADGNQGGNLKSSLHYVRPVRAF